MHHALHDLKQAAHLPGATKSLAWLENQHDHLAARVRELASINCGTANQQGVARVAQHVTPWLTPLADSVSRVPLPTHSTVRADGTAGEVTVADAVVALCRPHAPRRILLNIHLDTVYGPDHAFQTVTQTEPNLLRGPGVADAKGGLVVMLAALEAYERSRPHDELGWEVVLNPDEEVGSMSSAGLLHEAASRSDIGLVFEPTLPDGTLIHARKGSGNFTVVVRGRSAHAGRDIQSGRNAVHALSRIFVELEKLNACERGVTLNLGRISGGGPSNIVPNLALGWFNARAADASGVCRVQQGIKQAVANINRLDGITAELHGRFTSLPKLLDPRTQTLLDHVFDAGRTLGLTMKSAASGGVCDGNKLAAACLPTVDTLGPRGGHIHSDREYLLLDSLVERARLTCLLLHRFAQHPEMFPTRRGGHPTHD